MLRKQKKNTNTSKRWVILHKFYTTSQYEAVENKNRKVKCNVFTYLQVPV